jgi:hypothetical protein
MKFINITLKVANMRKEQEFTVYPTTKGDPHIYLQSDKRFMRIIKTNGVGIINGKNQNYANSIALSLDPVPFTLSPEDLKRVHKAIDDVQGLTNKDGSITLIGE